MNEPRQSRRLNTSGASGRTSAGAQNNAGRRINRTDANTGRTVYRAPAQNTSGGNSRYTYRSQQSAPGRAARPAAERPAPQPAARHGKQKKSALKGILTGLMTFVLVLCVGLFSLYQWVVRSISPEGGTPTISELINTPSEYKGDVINLLICGIDYEEGRAYSNDPESNDGMTDMIMYMNFDVKNKKINLLQIPRDTYVGENYNTGGTGKINAVALKNDGIASLAQAISEQYKLPIDYYFTINMQSLKEIVNLFGGIEVYIPRDIEYNGSKLLQGYRNLDGDAAEFLVRNRHGDGYAQGDIARLDMQRYFYQGLFKRIRTATVWDIAKLMPVVLNYVTTDAPGSTLISLGVSFLQVDSANIMLCKVPTASAAQYYNGQYSILVCDADKTRDLLNTYFRSYTGPVDQLDIPTLPTAGASSDPNVQYMGQLDTAVDDALATEGAA